MSFVLAIVARRAHPLRTRRFTTSAVSKAKWLPKLTSIKGEKPVLESGEHGRKITAIKAKKVSRPRRLSKALADFLRCSRRGGTCIRLSVTSLLRHFQFHQHRRLSLLHLLPLLRPCLDPSRRRTSASPSHPLPSPTISTHPTTEQSDSSKSTQPRPKISFS